VWLDGPGDGRIRGVSWVEGGNWMDDPWEIHEYTHVARDGSETLIGRGDAALDSDEVRLHANGDLAELVVEDTVFHRTREGKWTRFWAVDVVFIHLHYAPVPTGGRMERSERSWRHRAAPIHCRVSALDLQQQRMQTDCGWDRGPKLVFRRDSYDTPWVVDADATFAKNSPPEHRPFPDFVRATLTAVRITPAPGAAPWRDDIDQIEAMLGAPGVEQIARREFAVVNGKRIELPLDASEISRESWSLRGAWLDENGWPVVLWSEHPKSEHHGELRAQAFGAALRVHAQAVPGEDIRYAVYLELHPS